MKTFLVRGVPLAMQRDGWWLSGPSPAQKGRNAPQTGVPQNWRIGLLVALIALGDVMIWGVVPGLSLAVFGAAVVLAACVVAGRRITVQQQALVAGGTLLVLLPLVELVQPLSVIIAVTGVSAALALLAGVDPHALGRGVLRLWPLGVRQTFVDGQGLLKGGGSVDRSGQMTRLIMAWLMPVMLGLVFVLLLLAANPIAERWLDGISLNSVRLPEGARIAFWLCLLPVAWTALSLSQMKERLRAVPRAKPMGPARMGLINPASVTRALVMFNAVFAIQTLLDIVYLYGGVGLPEGITYAEYAHRGAYPLVVTALLAGAFALLTRPWVQGNPLLRVLLMLWVAQNVALVISSLVRLELYVDVYGLTHLRMAAAIWMALTAAGLALILWQVWQRRNNGWLMLRAGVLGMAVLYACTWVSFDATVARYNLNHGVKWDYYYLCNLGDAAKPVIAAYDKTHGVEVCAPHQYHITPPRDWREWGFRNWRARTSLEAIQSEARS